jgi:hypothetical protein
MIKFAKIQLILDLCHKKRRMRKRTPIYFILALLLSCLWCSRPTGNSTEYLYEQFKDPASSYRPFVRWWWNGDKVEAEELRRELHLLKEAGIGGVEINPVAFPTYCDSLDKPSLTWLSPEWIDMLKICFDEAQKLDMTCDLIVGSGWPFGAEYLEGDEQAQIVVNYGQAVSGPALLRMERDSLIAHALPKISSPYKGSTKELMALRLYPNPATNATDRIDLNTTDSLLLIDVPEGDYTLSALVKINGFMEVINGAPGASGPVLNHFNVDAVNSYLHTMSDSIQGRIGPLKGQIRALFTDSMELEGANWSSDMAEEFQQRYGYDILDYLPFILFKIGSMGSALNYDAVVPVTEEFKAMVERARYDFEDFKARLIMERFTQPYLDWCHQLGVKARAQAYGRGFYPLENAMGYDIPEGESWTTNWLRHKPGEEMSETDYRRGRAYTMVNKFVSSAAHLAGNRLVSCEEMTNTYTVFNMTMEQLKLGGDQSVISGITHSVFHGFNYSPNLEVPFPGWVRYGAYYSENNPWWPYFKEYTDYKARLSTALQHGTYYADIAILNPENDMWSTIGMQNEPFPNVTRAPYKTLLWESINKCGGGVDYVSENILQAGQVKNGAFRYKDRRYNTLILIDVERMHPETAQQLLRFVKDGGKLLCIDTIPYQSLGLSGDIRAKDSVVKACFDQIRDFDGGFVFAEPPKEGFLSWYDSLMQVEGLPHYLDIETPDPYVMQNRYTTDDGCELLFLCNTHRYHSHQTRIRFHRELTQGKHPWIWDLQTGERYPLVLNDDNSYDFDLGPVESMLVVFDRHRGDNVETVHAPSLHAPFLQRSTMNLSNDWDVELVHARLDTTIHAHFDTLFDLKDHPDYQHFAGTIIYRKTISLDSIKPYVLDLGRVEGVSELLVNGQSAGVKYYGRRIYDIGNLIQEGENHLEVRVTTTLGNYLKTLSQEESPTTWIYVNHPKRNQELQPMGMRGEVRI